MPTPQNGQTHSNNLSAIADELFECIWTFCGIGGQRVKHFSFEEMSTLRGNEWCVALFGTICTI